MKCSAFVYTSIIGQRIIPTFWPELVSIYPSSEIFEIFLLQCSSGIKCILKNFLKEVQEVNSVSKSQISPRHVTGSKIIFGVCQMCLKTRQKQRRNANHYVMNIHTICLCNICIIINCSIFINTILLLQYDITIIHILHFKCFKYL